MTNTNDRPASDLESELHRRYTQAFEQYANLTRAFMDQWQKAGGTAAPGPAPAAPDLAKTLSDWFQRSVVGADPSQAWARFAGLAGGPASAAGEPAGGKAAGSGGFGAGAAGAGGLGGGFPGGWGSGAAGTAPASGSTPLEQTLRQQEQVARRLFELGAQCQNLQTQLASHWAAVGQRTAQNFLSGLQGTAGWPGAAAAGSDPAQWTQKLYGAWIDTAEKAYQEAARGAEYVQLLASLTNAANAFKAEQNRLVELWATFFDHPTRSELDALQREMRELREELRELRRPR